MGGFEGGDEGGRIVTVGTPLDVSKSPGSYTGKYLKKLMDIQISIMLKIGIFT